MRFLALPACPACSHAEDVHRRESWYDEEGVEGMSCEECDCQWMTWDWAEVLSGEAVHVNGPDLRDRRRD